MPDVAVAEDSAGIRIFNQHRDLLRGVAYRVLGRVNEVEDVVQDTWLRWSGVRVEEVADPEAFLVRVATRLAIDRLRSAQSRRELYVGPWLPEPILTGPDVADSVALTDSVSTCAEPGVPGPSGRVMRWPRGGGCGGRRGRTARPAEWSGAWTSGTSRVGCW